jgi:Glycosyltransferase family 87
MAMGLAVGLAALSAYLVPRLLAARSPWPMWDVNVYWWGGRQALRDSSLYAAYEPQSFTYPPFAAAVFGLGSAGPEIVLKIIMTTLSLIALGAADLLQRHDSAWWQGIATGVAFAGTVAAGFILLPRQSRSFWLRDVFLNQSRIGNNYNPANQSLAGLACCGVTGVLVSPISWTHHWVWVIPLLVAMAATAWRRRSPVWALATAAWWTVRARGGSSGRMTPGPADMDRADDAERRTRPIA